METSKTYLLGVVLLCSTSIFGQGSNEPFHTIREHNNHPVINQAEEIPDSSINEAPIIVDSIQVLDIDFSNMSVEQLENLIVLYENYLHKKRERNTLIKENNQQILKYYNGESHSLTLTNLLDVIEEVGLNNQLFVLAQAVLETGHFTSPVCKNYHNLFGLYDSKHKDYYRFARWEDSVIGYQKFIQYRYKGGNYLQFLRRIGYAEDPRYTTKVAQIATQLYKRLFTQ